MMNKSYKILGLPLTATIDEVKKRYRQLALIYHPDKNNGTDTSIQFAEISNAYKTIINEPVIDIWSVLNKMMQSRIISTTPTQTPSYVEKEVFITLEELYHGTTKSVMDHVINIPAGYNINEPFIHESSLFLQITVLDHPTYTLDYPDLCTNVDITLCEALTGFERTLILLDSMEKNIKSDRVLCPNEIITIKNLGIINDGCLKICIKIHFPKSLNDDEKLSIKYILSNVQT